MEDESGNSAAFTRSGRRPPNGTTPCALLDEFGDVGIMAGFWSVFRPETKAVLLTPATSIVLEDAGVIDRLFLGGEIHILVETA